MALEISYCRTLEHEPTAVQQETQKAATDGADGIDGQGGELSMGPSQMEAAICEGPPGAHMLPGLFERENGDVPADPG